MGIFKHIVAWYRDNNWNGLIDHIITAVLWVILIFTLSLPVWSEDTDIEDIQSLRISDIRTFKWDRETERLQLRLSGKRFVYISFRSKCWDIEHAERLEFKAWGNRDRISVGDAILPMSFRGVDTAPRCYIDRMVRVSQG